jgi:cytochrome c553
MVIWSVRFSAPDLWAVRQFLRTTSIFSIGLITVRVASNSPPAGATDGKNLTLNGNGKGAHACSACHGAQGEGRPEAGYPRLAGLSADYLLRQLNDFADNNRENELMTPIAKLTKRIRRRPSLCGRQFHFVLYVRHGVSRQSQDHDRGLLYRACAVGGPAGLAATRQPDAARGRVVRHGLFRQHGMGPFLALPAQIFSPEVYGKAMGFVNGVGLLRRGIFRENLCGFGDRRCDWSEGLQNLSRWNALRCIVVEAVHAERPLQPDDCAFSPVAAMPATRPPSAADRSQVAAPPRASNPLRSEARSEPRYGRR